MTKKETAAMLHEAVDEAVAKLPDAKDPAPMSAPARDKAKAIFGWLVHAAISNLPALIALLGPMLADTAPPGAKGKPGK